MKKVLTSTIVLIILTSAIFAQTNRRNHRTKPAPIAIDQVHTHDPVMAKEGDTYYLFSTGFGVSVMSSKDMRTWKFEKPIFEDVVD